MQMQCTALHVYKSKAADATAGICASGVQVAAADGRVGHTQQHVILQQWEEQQVNNSKWVLLQVRVQVTTANRGIGNTLQHIILHSKTSGRHTAVSRRKQGNPTPGPSRN
jgi:hypothetical protein